MTELAAFAICLTVCLAFRGLFITTLIRLASFRTLALPIPDTSTLPTTSPTVFSCNDIHTCKLMASLTNAIRKSFGVLRCWTTSSKNVLFARNDFQMRWIDASSMRTQCAEIARRILRVARVVKRCAYGNWPDQMLVDPTVSYECPAAHPEPPVTAPSESATGPFPASIGQYAIVLNKPLERVGSRSRHMPEVSRT